MIPRDDVLRMAREAWGESGNGWVTDAWFSDRAEAFEAFALKVVDAAAIDPDLLRSMLAKAPPMPLAPMPAPPDDEAFVRERAARVAAQSELATLKERLARSGVEQRRAVLAEREACRAECQTLADILREHHDVEGAELAESLAEAIAARGAA